MRKGGRAFPFWEDLQDEPRHDFRLTGSKFNSA
jgi:hypothetical protein